MGNLITAAEVDVAAVIEGETKQVLIYYAYSIDRRALYDSSPLVRDQIRKGPPSSVKITVPKDTVVIPDLDMAVVGAILKLSDKRAKSPSLLRFTMSNLRTVNPNIPTGLGWEVKFYKAIDTLIARPLTSRNLADSIATHIKTECFVESKLPMILDNVSRNEDLAKIAIRRVLETYDDDDEEGAWAVVEMCRVWDCEDKATEIMVEIQKTRAEAKRVQEIEMRKVQKFKDRLDPKWAAGLPH